GYRCGTGERKMKDTEKKSWVYYVAIFLVKIWYAIMFKVEIIGKENIPETGNGVICSNHYSNYDPVSTAIYLDRLPHYIAKKELFKNKLFSWVLDQLGVFPIDRKVSMDMKAVKTAIKLLKEGKIVGIFAEGRRVKAGEDVAAKAGGALFAMKGNAPVIPCAISGTYKFRSKLTIRYGEPLTLDEFRDKKLTTELMGEITKVIMDKVEELKVKE
uniref:lysophospholipid acyltransferase family protein n=1 Tax=Anaerotignum faecicola TaxID=2358141 RepID=UPI003FD870A7